MIYRTNDPTGWASDMLEHTSMLVGLEAHTGADLLITTDEIRLTSLPDSLTLPLRNTLQHMIDHGLLVQVKIGEDFTSSIPNLSEILAKMLLWTKRPWLLNVLDLRRDRDGHAVINGRVSDLTFNECDGAADWWQLRGGMLNAFPIRNSDVYAWCQDWLARLRKLERDPVHFVTRPSAQKILPCDGRADVLARLMSPTFSGSGIKTAIRLLKHVGTLKHAMLYLSDVENCKVSHVEDIGEKRFETFRHNMELSEQEILCPIVDKPISDAAINAGRN